MPDVQLNRVFLSLGSNIRPEHHLCQAVRELERYGRVANISRVWESAPVGYSEQPNFLNAAALLETPLDAAKLRTTALSRIEKSLGRIRDPQNKNGPRTIDVDVVLFNNDVLVDESHRIPDPEILTRPFVALPLAELDPGYVHPETGQTLKQIAAGFASHPSGMLLRPDVVLRTVDDEAGHTRVHETSGG